MEANRLYNYKKSEKSVSSTENVLDLIHRIQNIGQWKEESKSGL